MSGVAQKMLSDTEKYSLAKFANFVCICVTRGKRYHFCGNFSSKMVTFPRVKQTIIYKTLQDYIFRILQHFTTKFCNSTNFKIFFLAVVKDFVLPAKFVLESIMQIIYCGWTRTSDLAPVIDTFQL